MASTPKGRNHAPTLEDWCVLKWGRNRTPPLAAFSAMQRMFRSVRPRSISNTGRVMWRSGVVLFIPAAPRPLATCPDCTGWHALLHQMPGARRTRRTLRSRALSPAARDPEVGSRLRRLPFPAPSLYTALREEEPSANRHLLSIIHHTLFRSRQSRRIRVFQVSRDVTGDKEALRCVLTVSGLLGVLCCC